MEITYNSDSRINIKLPNGKSIIIMYTVGQDELSLAFTGEGHRTIKEVQNRNDGHSSCTFTEQK